MLTHPLNELGIYGALGAQHLWSAWSYPTDGTWKALIGGVNLIAKTAGPPSRSTHLSNASTIRYQAALVCPFTYSGFYANIGAIGTAFTIVCAGISVYSAGEKYYALCLANGPGYAAPAPAALQRGDSISQSIGYRVNAGAGLTTPSFGTSTVPFVAICTTSGSGATLRLNQLSKLSAALVPDANYHLNQYIHVHGYQTDGSGRLGGDSICELAIFRRILSDADAVTLMNHRCGRMGISVGA